LEVKLKQAAPKPSGTPFVCEATSAIVIIGCAPNLTYVNSVVVPRLSAQ
jgi:hypothetical protein